MLSTLVFSPPVSPTGARPFGPLLRTLAALVPATIEGVVRDVTLLQIGVEGGVSTIADEAGCRFVEEEDFMAALARGVAAARSPWVFVVKAGAVPSRIFGEEAARALDEASGQDGVLLLRASPLGWARWFPSLAPVVGIILPRARLAETRCTSFAELVRRTRPARTLPTSAMQHR